MPIEGRDLEGHHVFTRNLAATASLLALGAQFRAQMPITVTKAAGKPDDILFWFESTPITVAEVTKPAEAWLGALICPWQAFDLSLEHPAAYLKAAAENRSILVSAVKRAQEHPFRVIQRGNRVALIGPGLSERNARRLLSQG